MSRLVLGALCVCVATRALAAQLEVEIHAAESGAALPNASVELNGRPAGSADKDGHLALEPPKSGNARLRVQHAGYQALEQSVAVPKDGTLSLLLAMTRVPGPGRIVGTLKVHDAQDPTKLVPAANVTVRAKGRPPVETDAQGAFVIPEAGPGPVSLALSGEGLKPRDEAALVPSYGEAKVEVVLERQGEKAVAAFRGQVRSKSGAPLRAKLRIAETRQELETKPDGSFEVSLPGGRYTVTFSAAGHVAQVHKVIVAPGEQALFYVNLSPQP